VPFVGGEAGRVIVDEGCPKNCPIRLKDEDLKGEDSLVPPLPGGPETEADAVYSPRGTIKVPDNFTCAITCQDGRATLRCWWRWWFPGQKPQLFLPGAPLPKGFPENPFVK
jgi:hypothetical protein